MMYLEEKREDMVRSVLNIKLGVRRNVKIRYQTKMNELVGTCKLLSEDKGKILYGCINVDYSSPRVNQLWGTLCVLIQQLNETMQPFLNIFVIYEGKGLSSFCREFEVAGYLRKYFRGYISKKIWSDGRDLALGVDDTEDELDPVKIYSEGSEGNRESNYKRK